MSRENNLPDSVSRRRILQGIGILSLSALSASLFPAIKAQAQEMNDSGFTSLSSFLVSRPINAILAQRYYRALVKNAPDFPTRLAELNRYINDHHFAHMDDFVASVKSDDARFTTASHIVAAWYTGVVGEDENMALIAYADAMMYLPTKGILVIPTYGLGPDTWGSKPVIPSSDKESNV